MESEEVLLDRKLGEIGPDLWFDLVFDDTKDALLRCVYGTSAAPPRQRTFTRICTGASPARGPGTSRSRLRL